jgi:hypothetical protein
VLQPFPIEVQNTGGMVPMQPGGLQLTPGKKHAAAPILQVTSQAHASPQLTSPPHAPLPVQLMLHAPVPQVTELSHEAPPLQVTLHAPVPQVTELPHDMMPPQVTLHVPRPQSRFLQVWWALHAIVQDVALPQLMPLLHWLGTEQATLQFQPAGHVIAWLQAAVPAAQSIVQVRWAALHDVHCDGHTAASPVGCGVSTTPESAAITQNPSTQVRPSAQRCWPSQAKSLVRWLTEQPATSATARAVQSASFMASLRA